MLIKIEQPPKAEFSQVWCDYKDGVRLLIASSNKPSFNRALELNNMQAEQELQGAKAITDDTAEGSKLAFNRAISHLLLGWTGIDAEPNKPFEYSAKNAEILCTQTQESLEIATFVINKAFELEKDYTTTLAEEVGKSSDSTSKESTE
ncbi:hypothetical protein OZX61_07310 [Acinetobacter sp. ESL0695]|uniref:hypothetical protein n=1 Tax=Acinetobacter sp. ESL0695 TaxID=2983215 RepID=UPI0023F27347|nr:hypothetical protein [Acinetobacter sp. ESL0695]WEV48097.1 hypothetical protein OZX61_07310 [Acinetobacter sp. ESL0695]